MVNSFFKEAFHLVTSLVGIFCSSRKNFFFHIFVFSLTSLNGSSRYIVKKEDDLPLDYNKMTILIGTSMVVGYGAIACKNYIDGKSEDVPRLVELGLDVLAVVTPSLSLLTQYNHYQSKKHEQAVPISQDAGTIRCDNNVTSTTLQFTKKSTFSL